MRDSFHRPIDYLRISVSDRCNLRRVYCLPPEGVALKSREEVLTYDETVRVVQAAAYQITPEVELMTIQEVRLAVPQEDLPGPPLDRLRCDCCGEGINDRRAVRNNGHVLCRACATGVYYESA